MGKSTKRVRFKTPFGNVFSDLTRTLPDPLGAHSTPRPPAELSNRYLTQMRIGAQRTAFKIHHCTKMQGFIVVTCSIWGEFELNLNIICLRFMTNMINYVAGLAETKKCPQDLTFTKNRSSE